MTERRRLEIALLADGGSLTWADRELSTHSAKMQTATPILLR